MEFLRDLSVGQVFSEGDMNWRVLDVDSYNNRTLVITQDIIALMFYHHGDTAVTWAGCTLRGWLNNEFFDSLSPVLKSRVQIVTNQNNAGGATQDKVFLLSVTEAKAYFGSDVDRVARYNGSVESWWLRSRGERGDAFAALVVGDDYYAAGDFCAARIKDDNGVYCGGYYVLLDFGVRPALWLNL